MVQQVSLRTCKIQSLQATLPERPGILDTMLHGFSKKLKGEEAGIYCLLNN
jgi:hypothetical protein